jgi:hypothetical protein
MDGAERPVHDAKRAAAPRAIALSIFSRQRSSLEDDFANEFRDSPRLQRKTRLWFHPQMIPDRL